MSVLLYCTVFSGIPGILPGPTEASSGDVKVLALTVIRGARYAASINIISVAAVFVRFGFLLFPTILNRRTYYMRKQALRDTVRQAFQKWKHSRITSKYGVSEQPLTQLRIEFKRI
jgi:hypothetical protein